MTTDLNRVWRESTSDRSRIAAYLAIRGLAPDCLGAVPDDVLRYHPALPYWEQDDDGNPVRLGNYPAIVAKVINADGEMVSIHRTYLSPDGAGKLELGDDRPAKKLMTATTNGATKGAAIKLMPAGSVIGLSEGIETALAVAAATGQHVWSTVSAGGMEAVVLPGEVRTVHLWADNDRSGRGQQVAKAAAKRLRSEGRTVFVHLPPDAGSDWLDVYADAGPEALLAELFEHPAPPDCLAIGDVVKVFQRWRHLPDPSALLAVLATVAANLLPGDPVWLMLVGVPSSGKSEIIQSVNRLPGVHLAATLTEGALLSGTSRKERAQSAKGGLLREVGDFGIVVAKDFGSALSMNRDTRAALFAALREIYDGDWTRHVGTDGGQALHWTGKVGFIAGVTPAIDRHHEALASLGDRFFLFRLPQTQEADQAQTALRFVGCEKQMRQELGDAVVALFEGITIPSAVARLREVEIELLSSLATFAAHSRSTVVRDSYTRDIELIPGAEAPARLALALAQLLSGLRVIGVDEGKAWSIVFKTAFDSMPAIRRQVLDVINRAATPLQTAEVAAAAGYPTNTTARALEDLAIYNVIVRGKRDGDGRGVNIWELSQWSRDHLNVSPEMSVGVHGS